MKILKKEILAEITDTRITKVEIDHLLIAEKAKPGQFVVLMVSEEGERIPLTVVSTNKSEGTVTIIFQELGLTTKLLGKLKEGDALYSMVGPLGHATPIKKYGRVMLIGGGVGIAEIYPVAEALKGEDNHVTTILGARTKDLVILENELKDVSDEIYVATDDGSYGKKGFTTNILEELLEDNKYDLVYTVGPIPMMRKVSDITKGFNIKTLVSLNALMVDGTGMCGCCRVTVDNKVKFTCVDGPEFDAHLVDWDEMFKRSRIYCDKEGHACNIGLKKK